MNLTNILVKLLPFLYSLATRVWANLSTVQKDAASRAVLIIQRVKSLIYDTRPKSIQEIVLKEFGVALEIAFIIHVQDSVKSGLSDLEWNQTWKLYGERIANMLSPNGFDWKSFALGVIEIAFEKVIKK